MIDLDPAFAIIGLVVALGGPPLIARWGRSTDTVSAHLAAQAMLVGLAAIVVLIVVANCNALSDLGIRGLGVSTLLWAAATAVFFIFVAGPLLMRLPAVLGRPGFERGLSSLNRLPAWYLVLAVIVGGIVEELLYRGFAVQVLGTLIGNTWLAAAFVVIAFGLAHLPLWGLVPALTTMVSGAILTVLFLVHHDLIANMLAHIATDMAGIVFPRLRGRRRRA